MIWQVQNDTPELHVDMMDSTSGGVMVSLASSTGSFLELLPVNWDPSSQSTHLTSSAAGKGAGPNIESNVGHTRRAVHHDVEAARLLVEKSRRAREALLDARVESNLANSRRHEGSGPILSIIAHLKSVPVVSESEMCMKFGRATVAMAISVLKELGLIRRPKPRSSAAWEYVEEQEALLRNLRTHLNLHFSMRQLRARLEAHRSNLLMDDLKSSARCTLERSVE